AAGVDLELLGGGVDPAAAALLELEVLHDVGHVGLAPGDPGLLERAGEAAPGRADERMAGAVLAIARLLADEHQAGAGASLAEDRLRRMPPEVAAATRLGRLPG